MAEGSIDARRFELARQKTFTHSGGIGTLGERTLHAVLKDYYCPEGGQKEVKIGGYVADIVSDCGIIEIQTRSLVSLRPKLDALLGQNIVRVVYPIARKKWLIWLDGATGEATKKRLSPLRGTPFHAFRELYWIKQYLRHPNLRLTLALVDLEEIRRLDGWGRGGKRGSTRLERLPLELIEEICLDAPGDWRQMLPEGLEREFVCKDFAKLAKITAGHAQKALGILSGVGAVTRTGKRGNAIVYRKS